ncbi:PREDICTED: uncharacterized protein LOC108563634 [Nicrophorus vespilloides]|uniref:Uncharacterized protein LOC108563634 n=1 Tax=Nicrophorus vespilloides TaxID=110193 RepID=A0ABM1MTG0_NICVS|nr:PREDICTED: uncharacterized protein LOC108563634 [Nicrophorus vespilloides]
MKGNNKLDNIFQDDIPLIDEDIEDNIINDGDESESSIVFNNEDGDDIIVDDFDEPESPNSETMRNPNSESLPTTRILVFNSVKQEMVSNDFQREENNRLLCQVQELQTTLNELSQRLDQVKKKNLRLKSENILLGQYIGTLISASNVYSNASL